MGIQLVSKTANYEDIATSLAPNIVNGLIGAWLYKATNSGRNLAPLGEPSSVIGTMIQSGIYGQKADANNYIQTQIDLQNLDQYTIISVHKKPTTLGDGYETSIVSMNESRNKKGNWGVGRGIFHSANVLYNAFSYFRADGTFGTSIPNLSVAQMSEIGVYVGRIAKSGSTYTNTIKNLTANISKDLVITDVADTQVGSDNKLRLLKEGDRARTTLAQTYSATAYVTLIYNRALSDSELDKVHDWIKAYCSKRSIMLG